MLASDLQGLKPNVTYFAHFVCFGFDSVEAQYYIPELRDWSEENHMSSLTGLVIICHASQHLRAGLNSFAPLGLGFIVLHATSSSLSER